MCSTDPNITLSQSEDCQITYCKGCRTFSLTYKTCCASFTIVELDQFRQILGYLKKGDFQYDLMGEKRAIVKNQYASIGFCLTIEEVSILKLRINEAFTLFEAFHILYK